MRYERDSAKAQVKTLISEYKSLEADSSKSQALLSSNHQTELSKLHTNHSSTKTEFSNLQSQHQRSVAEIQSLKQQLEQSQKDQTAKLSSDQLHSDLKKYMTTLKRQYGTDRSDIEELKRDMIAEDARREEDSKKLQDMRTVIAAELGQILGDGS